MYYIFINNELVDTASALSLAMTDKAVVGTLIYASHRSKGIRWHKFGYSFKEGMPITTAITKPCWFVLGEEYVPPECKAMILLLT